MALTELSRHQLLLAPHAEVNGWQRRKFHTIFEEFFILPLEVCLDGHHARRFVRATRGVEKVISSTFTEALDFLPVAEMLRLHFRT